MRAVGRDPAGGQKPVALVNRQPLDDFPMISRGAEDK